MAAAAACERYRPAADRAWSMQPPRSGVRLAEIVAALSLATDLGMGQPMEFALRTCVLAVRLGDVLGLDERELRDIYYVALLRSAGCTAEAPFEAMLFW
jgi:hypothetical protein